MMNKHSLLMLNRPAQSKHPTVSKHPYLGQHHQVRQLLSENRSEAKHISFSHGGRGLADPIKTSMENLFQQDFSNIKLHTNSTKAEELGANAFTQGTTIHFAPGQYHPHSRQGQRLIAHELTHVVQQDKQPIQPTNRYHGRLINDNLQLERAAERMGQQAIQAYTPAPLTQVTSNTGKPLPSLSSTQPIQKDDNGSGSFDIDFTLLPPQLQLRLWVLSLDANTSRVRLSHDFGNLTTGLNYNYGGALSADLRSGDFSSSVGINPSNYDLSLGGSYRGFRFGANGNIGQRSLGMNLGYGAPLLPFPQELAPIFTAGAQSLEKMASNIALAPNDPLAWYGLHSDDISTITRAVNTGRQIYRQQTSPQRFGAGLRLSYSPDSGFLIYGGVQLFF